MGSRFIRKTEEQMLQAPVAISVSQQYRHDQDQWMILEGDDDEDTYNTCSLDNSSNTTNGSTSSSSDVVDDASSPTSILPSSSSSSSKGPLFELSELMAHLPIKRGLSKYYQGKSQSFTSLSNVTAIEDLRKKETPHRRKIKASKSYGNGLDAHKSYTLPKAIITKKVSRGSSLSALSFPGRRGSSSLNIRPPLAPVQKKFPS